VATLFVMQFRASFCPLPKNLHMTFMSGSFILPAVSVSHSCIE